MGMHLSAPAEDKDGISEGIITIPGYSLQVSCSDHFGVLAYPFYPKNTSDTLTCACCTIHHIDKVMAPQSPKNTSLIVLLFQSHFGAFEWLKSCLILVGDKRHGGGMWKQNSP